MRTRTDIRNRNDGPGTQNNNNGAGSQTIISGGEVHFIHNFNPAERNPHKTLWDAIIGIGASHDAEQQYERGECLQGTRERAIQRIFNWILSPGEHPLLWLTGAAGVGKSAIAMTVARLCEENGRLVASFFFFRADPKRNNPSALILTIAYGLITTMPLLRNPIEQRISRDPRILEARMEDQFRELVVKPLAPVTSPKLHRKPSPPENIEAVARDGLDECSDEDTQKRVLSTIRSAFQQSTSFPLRFLICSRPESWLRHAFDAEPLRSLHERIVLDDSFEPDEDIERYYRHHFQEIVNDPQHSQVRFPNPWPSEEEMEILVERTNGQFVYAATAVKFIKARFILPTEQLQVVLRKTMRRRPGVSPFAQLDALYGCILSFNPHYEDVSPILAAILLIPDAARSPTCLELVLGLSKGQVALMLRGMHSVLDIGGPDDEIYPFHNSFREYLFDPNRSGSFHIDERTWTHAIARTWLQNLSTNEIQGYSYDQLWDEGNIPFFTEWIQLCTSIPEPTRDLLDALRNVDLAATFVLLPHTSWESAYEELVPWVREYPMNNKGNRENNSLGLVEDLVHKLQNHPPSFHLEWPPDASPPDDAVHWILNHATGCPYDTSPDGSRPSAINNVCLTDCRCDLSGELKSHDPWHLTYQEACWKLVKAHISLFEELSESGEKEELTSLFINLTQSQLLKHCGLDAELLACCQKFLELAKGCLILMISSDRGEKGRKNVLRWFETFPDTFAAEGDNLKAQLLGLPWKRWAQNFNERWDQNFNDRWHDAFSLSRGSQ